MATKQKQMREKIKELCMAHSQLVHAKTEHKKKSGGSQILEEMYEVKIRELEGQITTNVKSWLGQE